MIELTEKLHMAMLTMLAAPILTVLSYFGEESRKVVALALRVKM